MDVHLSLTANSSAPSVARRAVDTVEAELGTRIAENIRLLISELVTNSIRHSGALPVDVIELAILPSPEAIRIEVWDGGSWRPPSPDPTGTSGWGLYLVDQLADRWGVERNGGTRAWFEIDRDRSGGARGGDSTGNSAFHGPASGPVLLGSGTGLQPF